MSVAKPLRLGLFELRLLFRTKATAVSAVILPFGLCGLTWFSDRGSPDEKWGDLLGTRFTMLMMLVVFMSSLTVYTARRQSLVLKRLRTSELTDFGLIAGISAPVLVLGLAQIVVYFGFSLAVGAPPPKDPLLVLAGVVLGVLLTMAAGLATAAVSTSVEATHVTSFPVITLTLAGLFMVHAPQPAVAVGGAAMPLLGPADLITKGWTGADAGIALDALPGGTLGLVSILVWALVFGAVIARNFRWEPRS